MQCSYATRRTRLHDTVDATTFRCADVAPPTFRHRAPPPPFRQCVECVCCCWFVKVSQATRLCSIPAEANEKQNTHKHTHDSGFAPSAHQIRPQLCAASVCAVPRCVRRLSGFPIECASSAACKYRAHTCTDCAVAHTIECNYKRLILLRVMN